FAEAAGVGGPAGRAVVWPAPLRLQDIAGKSSAPRGFLCAITHEVMTQPALLLSPQLTSVPSYERDAVERWLQRCCTDPRTRTPLRSYRLMPNDDLRRAIDDWARGIEE
ncbi:hypothetical protein Agub_g9347, partial [Astrephomene gubernaculifera]